MELETTICDDTSSFIELPAEGNTVMIKKKIGNTLQQLFKTDNMPEEMEIVNRNKFVVTANKLMELKGTKRTEMDGDKVCNALISFETDA
eukprot:gene11153-20038_t